MYPIKYTFKRIALANKVTAVDANGNTLLYAHQKLLKIREKILLYTDDTQATVVGELNADKVIDFSVTQSFTDVQGQLKLKVKRVGKASIWRAHFEIMNAQDVRVFTVREDRAWIKVIDTLMSEIPIIGLLTGYVFNPVYNILNEAGERVGQIVKQPAFLESSYVLNLDNPAVDSEGLLPVGTLTVITRERSRG